VCGLHFLGVFLNEILNFSLFAGIFGAICAVVLAVKVYYENRGSERMREVARAVRQGVVAFSKVEYSAIIFLTIILSIVIYFALGFSTAFSFIIGAIASAVAGLAGMLVAARANVRTAEASKTSFEKALNIAFLGGSVTGLIVSSLGLIGIIMLLYLFNVEPSRIIGFGFGASLVSLFIRVGGGIYTKAADVGADLVGKVEAGIPEDDPRNPAVIADNVGDNVGDCAGMAADMFESYVVTIIAAMLLAPKILEGSDSNLILFPVLIASLGLISSIIGIFFTKDKKDAMNAFYKGVGATNIVFILLLFSAVTLLSIPIQYFFSCIIGIVAALLLGLITDYYTSPKHKPVQHIAKMSQTGATTNILSGLTVGMESTLVPVLVVALGIVFAFGFGGLFGIGLATTAMLATIGIFLSIDAYGPIVDNAGGIVVMAKLGEEARKTTDKLDSAGNITKATTKGIAIGAAALSAVAIFAAYDGVLIDSGIKVLMALDSPNVVFGLVIGAVLPFVFSSFCLGAVTSAAFEMVEEVRRQLKDGEVLKGRRKPDYARCVEISTKASLRGLVRPALLALASPLIIGFLFGPEALGGLILGVTATGFVLALMMANTGAAWDNAKKYIEEGNYGGKGTETHSAAVIGDTIGDPYKDTAGPSINALIKVIGTLSLLIARLL